MNHLWYNNTEDYSRKHLLCAATKNNGTSEIIPGHPHCNIPQYIADITYIGQTIALLPALILIYLIIKKLKSFGNIGIILILLLLSGICYCL